MALTGEDLKALIKKQPIGFACGVICIACGAAFYFRIDAVETARSNLEGKTVLADKYQTNLRNSAGLAEHTAAMQAAGKELDARLLRVNQLALNQQYFYRLEAETGVKLIDVRQQNVPAAAAGKAKSKTGTVGIPFAVTAQGDFRQLVAFIQQLESGTHFARFNTLALQPMAVSAEGAAGGANTMMISVGLELLGLP